MATSRGFKPHPTDKRASDLLTTLNNSKMSTENNALYQTIAGLITIAQKLQDGQITVDVTEGNSNTSSTDGFNNFHPFLFV